MKIVLGLCNKSFEFAALSTKKIETVSNQVISDLPETNSSSDWELFSGPHVV